jgi:prefoldin subunit 5
MENSSSLLLSGVATLYEIASMRSRAPRTLTKKRNALAYEREQLKSRIVEIGQEIAALDYTLQLLEPN